MRELGRNREESSKAHKKRKGLGVLFLKAKMVLVSLDIYRVTGLMPCPFSLVSQHHKIGFACFGQ